MSARDALAAISTLTPEQRAAVNSVLAAERARAAEQARVEVRDRGAALLSAAAATANIVMACAILVAVLGAVRSCSDYNKALAEQPIEVVQPTTTWTPSYLTNLEGNTVRSFSPEPGVVCYDLNSAALAVGCVGWPLRLTEQQSDWVPTMEGL